MSTAMSLVPLCLNGLRLAGKSVSYYIPFMKSKVLTDQLSAFLFWDVDPSGINPETHRQFIIPRVMERGTRTDVRVVWDYYGSETVKSALLNAADLSAKTISFFANQFNLSRDAFRAFRNPANHWAS